MSDNSAQVDVALLSGGWDRPYAFGLTNALLSDRVRVELIAGDDLTSDDFGHPSDLTILNLRISNNPSVPLFIRAWRLLAYYWKLIAYAWRAKPRRFHILWNNGYDTFDRVVLMLYYRVLGRTLYLTAHNVNVGARDNRDSTLNRLTLKFQYRLCDHVFVHTDDMKRELVKAFGVRPDSVTVVPFGINDSVPRTALTPEDARRQLGFSADDRVLLFFGNIAPYKGLEYLVRALPDLLAADPRYRLIIAGRVKAGCDAYWGEVQATLNEIRDPSRVTLRNEFIPDEETELYFKAADLLVLPYVHIFQSGVLFLGFGFGLPAIVADVGSLKAEVIEDQTGFSFRPRDSASLRDAVSRYFSSSLSRVPDADRRAAIIDRAHRLHSWQEVATRTREVYLRVDRA
jgi:glycosyltransferase involved in cell wall biosynthesis